MTQPAAHPLWTPAPRRIAVFRALQLGDLLCAVPALRALRAAQPQARITLVGLPWAERFVERFRHLVDDFLAFPGFPGFPEREAEPSALIDFLMQARRRRFHLALQLHGSGRMSNYIVSLMSGGRCAGFHPADRLWTPGERFLPWPERGHEVQRCLALMRHLGLPSQGEQMEFPLSAEERRDWARRAAALRLKPRQYVCLHPGARLPSRRWPAARFIEVGRALAAHGWPLVITGAADERELTAPVAAALGGAAIDLTGETSLGELGACLAQARLLVSNDTGVSHLAAGVRTPSVIVSSGADVERWAPLDHALHRTLWQDAPCRPCAHVVCPVAGHPCATGVSVKAVLEAVHASLEHRQEAA